MVGSVTKDKRFLTQEEVYQIYLENGIFIRSVIRFHLGNSPDCDDVFQSLFLRLLEKPVPCEQVNQRGYLYRMITNNIINKTNRAKARKQCISRYSQIPPSKTATCDPYEYLAQEDEFNFVMQIIDNCLPARLAKALKLRYIENYSNDQIARATSVKKNTVVKHISTGLKKLRRISKRCHLNKCAS